ncbi:ABC transporter permease [Dyadobacter sediminis]|uniref:FtsX-like permease family protein n=1 Tax=Dyadobacter sediminis TaxID=1493691 RepID=A0A5R9KA45_9BACT|nr:ABC transporter permease [Dyadobacter sediminis]TLU91703.1 FtsX-like permease family protein [Dyadobacter sediminis]GGC01039.1 ABC transporter permease [Dyadobacter sediminis]
MVHNYLKIAWRNLFRNKVYSFINIAGLAMGIAAFLLILEYVSFEKSVNQFHASLPDMYRMLNINPKGETWTEVEPGWGAQAKQNFPEIKEYCRFAEGYAKGIVKRADAKAEPFREANIGYAEGNFFDFFSFPLLAGNKAALSKPKVVFISKNSSVKYFGNDDPIGKVLTLSNQFGTHSYSVEGIYEIPANSDIQFDMIFSLETLANPANLNGNDWATLDNLDSQFLSTYFLLAPNTNVKSLETKLSKLRDELKTDKDGVKFGLQAFGNVHLSEKLGDTYQTSGNLKYVYMLLIIAVLILLIAWFNYINLSTANAFKRANEVGVRKVIGATPGNLIAQFLGESMLVNMLAISSAVLLISVLQPFFNELVGKELSLATLGNSSMWLAGACILLSGSAISGVYTAFALSRFNPVKILKGNLVKSTKGILLRKSLVISQFTISIVLILATIVIYAQLRFMQSRNLGISTEQLLVVRGPEAGNDSTYQTRQAAFYNELGRQSYVKDYSLSGTVPGNWYNFKTSGFTQSGSRPGDEFKTYSFAIIDNHYLDTYGIQRKAGRNFTSQEVRVDWNSNSKVILNEKAVEQFGFQSAEEAVQNKIKWDERYLEVIGVVKNYHHTGLQHAIDPIIFYPQNNNTYITIRLAPGHIQDKMARMESMYKNYFAGNPFDYFFADENFNKQYVSEKQYGKIFTSASVWAIFIACMGLFGLATFTVETRTKEIGIRKVLGASVASIAGLLSADFLKLVFVSIIIASPLAWYFMNSWLEGFEYQVKLSWWIFAAGGTTAILIAVLTVGFQSIKAAMVNPVKSLKSD